MKLLLNPNDVENSFFLRLIDSVVVKVDNNKLTFSDVSFNRFGGESDEGIHEYFIDFQLSSFVLLLNELMKVY